MTIFADYPYRMLTAARVARNRVSNLLDPPVIILVYHRVAALPSDPQMLAVTPDNFRAQLLYLKENFPVIPLEDGWRDLKTPAVVITFDDGYADNALQALPIVEEAKVPVTFFVSTGTIGSRREFWWDELERILLGEWPFPGELEMDGRRWPAATFDERLSLYGEMHSLLWHLSAHEREKRLALLRRWAQAGPEGRETHRPMSVEELKRLAGSPWVTIGAHTVSHTALSALSPQAQREEIAGSKRDLESWLGRPVTLFSYPYGRRRDYSGQAIRACREAGFLKAVSNFHGQAHRWTDPYQLPRQLVRNWELDVFVRKLNRFWVL